MKELGKPVKISHRNLVLPGLIAAICGPRHIQKLGDILLRIPRQFTSPAETSANATIFVLGQEDGPPHTFRFK